MNRSSSKPINVQSVPCADCGFSLSQLKNAERDAGSLLQCMSRHCCVGWIRQPNTEAGAPRCGVDSVETSSTYRYGGHPGSCFWTPVIAARITRPPIECPTASTESPNREK